MQQYLAVSIRHKLLMKNGFCTRLIFNVGYALKLPFNHHRLFS